MTILLAWNPKKFPWGDLEEELAQYRARGSSHSSWSIGNRKSIEIGTRFFMIRLGQEPRGIVASGHTKTAPYDGKHWNPEDAEKGVMARYAEIEFDYLSEEPAINYTELKCPPLDKCRWSTQISGITIPGEVAAQLEKLWRERTGGDHTGTPEEYENAVALNEGVAKRVYVNKYERNREARAICLAHYKMTCAVCRKRMSDKYLGISDALINVHHIVPISEVGKTYVIDPIRDLCPVCPNCHAVIHSENPPLLIESARTKVKRETGSP
jgi:5-methylcytosine-specific restriction protein A